MNDSERQLQEFIEFKNSTNEIGFSLEPQGDSTIISEKAINLCVLTIGDKKFYFGGISESFYDKMVMEHSNCDF